MKTVLGIKAKRGVYKAFREYLNARYGKSDLTGAGDGKWRMGDRNQYGNRKRQYGDWLYFQDRRCSMNFSGGRFKAVLRKASITGSGLSNPVTDRHPRQEADMATKRILNRDINDPPGSFRFCLVPECNSQGKDMYAGFCGRHRNRAKDNRARREKHRALTDLGPEARPWRTRRRLLRVTPYPLNQRIGGRG